MNDHRPTTTDHRPSALIGGTPLVSLVVVAFNSAAHFAAFFEALATTKYEAYEVIVVDNASQDATLHYLAKHQPQVRVIANAENAGFGRACNQGARIAAGEVLVFMNPDVLVTPGWLATLVQHLVEQPDAGIICPQTMEPGARSQEPESSNGWHSPASRLPPPAFVEEVAAVPGCALMMPREVWRTLGGFDETIFLYWEDTELCWRAWLHGWRVLSDHVAVVYHERGGSGGGNTWDAERLKHGLYTYGKLMRWRRVVPFVARQAAGTLVKLARGRGQGLLGAWAWVFQRLGLILAERRELRRTQCGDVAALEQLINVHTRRMRAAHSRKSGM